MSKLKSIDLFAGIGGIRLGFDNAFGKNIETVFVSEWDEYAKKTYTLNFNDDFDVAGDITKIKESDIPEFDICLAGFPCQAFSLAGKRMGFEDDYKGMCRGTLFQDVVRICDYHKPKVIFCENVKGLTIHDKGRTFKVIKKAFEQIGYTVYSQILNSKNFGVPQNRERIYIVCFRNDIDSSSFVFPNATDTSKCIGDILEAAPISPKYYLSDVYMETLRKHKARHESKGNGFGYEIRPLDGIAGAIVCGGMGRERNLIIDHREHSMKPVTHIKGEINKEGVRKMTPREWARLQGFPDTYKLELSDTHLYKQFGNSVTVNVIEAIATKIKEVLDMPKLSGNKGEWSEIYAILRLLEVKRLYAADAELNKKGDMFYNIINITRTEPIGKLEFGINKESDTVSVVNADDKSELLTLPCSEFKTAADNLYREIIDTTAAAFELPDTADFLETLNIGVLKAKSTDKADIRIKIHDINTGYETVQGFSIKSRLGSPSTLVNAGKTTNFVFEVTGNMTDAVMDEFNTCSKKFKDRFDVLNRYACNIEYVAMENDIFESNLQLIDGDLPKICAYMLKEYYSSGINTVKSSLDSLSEHNPIGYDLSKGHPFYEYKFKKFLAECALGMLPSKVWDGTADATGGYIIVREDGEVLCYHLFNRNEFETYLVNNTKFETASTSRHEFGTMFKKSGKYYIKLNLQIRFIR